MPEAICLFFGDASRWKACLPRPTICRAYRRCSAPLGHLLGVVRKLGLEVLWANDSTGSHP
jgi:hypothetical protein